MSIFITTKPGSSGGGGALYTSSRVTSTSSTIAATSFTTFSNSPGLSFTPAVTGTYKVYASVPIQIATVTDFGTIRVFNTTGGGTLLAESQAGVYAVVTGVAESVYCQSTYTLTAGTAYVFDLQGQMNSGTGSVSIVGNIAAFYMFAELIPVSGSVGTPTVNGSAFITSGTTYTTPANITASTNFKFTLIGGGGGGGGSNGASSKGGGGGSGAGGQLFISGLTASTAYTIAIGANGAGGTNVPTSGGNGGSTSITISGNTYICGGGTGGPTAVQVVGGAGGSLSGTAFTVSIPGQSGAATGASNAASVSGSGGSAAFGMGLGGGSVNGTANTAGMVGSGFGGGGSGGALVAAGGAGTAGCILVEYWT